MIVTADAEQFYVKRILDTSEMVQRWSIDSYVRLVKNKPSTKCTRRVCSFQKPLTEEYSSQASDTFLY